MIHEEWLSSSCKLCDLVYSAESGQSDDPAHRVINIDLYPKPAYNPSLIQQSLERYSQLLDATLPQNIKGSEHFAQKTAQTLLDSAKSAKEQTTFFAVTQDGIEMLAAELTLQVCCNAMEEMDEHNSDPATSYTCDRVMGTSKNTLYCSSGIICDKNPSEVDTNCKMGEYTDTPCLAYANPLKEMASFGSTEYPDAPPSTPLFPEMIRGQGSFRRQLKGGLAKEFHPSTPPPTPKDHMLALLEKTMKDESTDLIINLLRSLSLENCQNKVPEKTYGTNDKLNDFATQLSKNVLHCITTKEVNSMNASHLKCIWNCADQLASEIVSASLAEVSVKEAKVYMPSDKRTSFLFSATDGVKGLADEIIINAMIEAFAKIQLGDVNNETKLCFKGQGLCLKPWEEESFSKKMSFKHKSHWSTSADDVIKVTSPLELQQRFANNLAKDVLQLSIIELFCEQSNKAETGSSIDIKPKVIKIQPEKSIQELQCALLWAVASQDGTSKLQFDLPDTTLQQQLSKLSQSARLNGWTVGTLMASLQEFCSIHSESSRGQHKSYQSLLDTLQYLIDNVRLN
ncbi:hypothetical protein DNTS_032193 [Danionella cerebrum]|uniref:Uncharacterized protein n=1 Tax=Danionella cerebrum TaxID=2873325 RepID=A0A553PUT0_9TELE|nr:hypothetical protein DNTS_032193 [Danionella translucida]